MDELNNDAYRPSARIVVIGVGGGGSNAVNRMVAENIADVEFYVCNTDQQSLTQSCLDDKHRILLGPRTTGGLGAGGNPQVGEIAAKDSENEIREIVKGANLVFVASGMGGGTGTGASPLIAEWAKDEGALTVAIVTRPFSFEGKKRHLQSIEGLNKLKEHVDSLIVVSNDKLLMLKGNTPTQNAFEEADRILMQSVRTIIDLIIKPSIINSDFADVRNVLADSGVALIGYGLGKGANKSLDAANNALNSPLLEANIAGAKRGICSVTVAPNVTLYEAQETVTHIIEAAGNEIDIKFSIAVNDKLDDAILVSVIASDFGDNITFEKTPTPFVAPTFIKQKEIEEKVTTEDKKVEVGGSDTGVSSSLLPDFLLDLGGGDDEK